MRSNTPFFQFSEISKSREMLSGSCLIGYRDMNGAGDTLFNISDSIEMFNNEEQISSSSDYRYIRLLPVQDTIALCEISFFESDQVCSNIKITADLIPLCSKNENLNMICDNLSATGFKGYFKNQKDKEKGIWFDLGKKYCLNKIVYNPYISSDFNEDSNYALFYWDKQWVYHDEKQGVKDVLTFHNVPSGTVYKIISNNFSSRIFKFENGLVYWY